MLKAGFAVALLLALAPAAHAGEPAKAAGKPPAKPASALLADALKSAHKSGKLKAILAKQSFRSEDALVTWSGKATKQGTTISLRWALLKRPVKVQFTYAFDADGKLRSVNKSFGPLGMRVDFQNGTATAVLLRPGRPAYGMGKRPCDPQVIPRFLAELLLPALHAELPRAFRYKAVMEKSLGRARTEVPWTTFRRSAKPTKSPHGLVYEVTLKTQDLAGKALVAASGKHKGRVLQAVLNDKVHVAQTKPLDPRVINEQIAAAGLKAIHHEQSRRPKGFAASLSELVKGACCSLAHLTKGYSGYTFLIRRSPDKQRWMAIAFPNTPGKTGRLYFAVNQQGKIHASPKQVHLTDSCWLPK